MSETDSYLSIANESRGVYREKASKFIAIAIPVNSESKIKENLEAVRKEFYDARHHCFAYRIGYENHLYRVNDDGEPSGSAGRPIYGQILSMNLSDVLVVVVRYFGGTKLGIPGLINAYRTATREALEKAEIRTKILTVQLDIVFDYPSMNEVMRIIKEEAIQIIGQQSDVRCSLRISVKKSKMEMVYLRLNKLKNLSISLHE